MWQADAPAMSLEAGALLNRLNTLNFEFVGDKLRWDGKISADEWPVLRDEFRRFICLVGLGIAPLAMISPKIDEVWHQFVLFTRKYEEFCRDAVGFYIHHTPETIAEPIPLAAAANLVHSYEEFFGSLPSVWTDGLEESIRAQYAERPLTKKPPVRWSGWTGR